MLHSSMPKQKVLKTCEVKFGNLEIEYLQIQRFGIWDFQIRKLELFRLWEFENFRI